ncbi:hypothetical protein [Brevundimonas sp.]|uniref:hypothetical protein n=1 Tax=Brevundimonas sp. TaxID=1871086 RepID=UPI0035B02DA4
MTFSATDAAFEGFRVVRRAPMSLVFWALFYVVVMAVAFAMMGPSLASAMASAERLESVGTPTLDDFMPIMNSFGLVFSILLPVSLLSSAVMSAAIARSVLYPTQKALGYLRLGADELRVLAVSVALGIIFIVLMGLIWGMTFALGAAAVNTPVLWLIVVVFFLVAWAAFIWLLVRLSLAVPMTLAEKRIVLFDSFSLTKRHFWPLVGMAIIAGVMSFVVSMLGSLVLMPIQLMSGGMETLATVEGLNLVGMLQQAWPAILSYVVVNAIISALQVAVIYAPFSAAYRDIAGRTGAGLAETFG